ncbi:MAG TPA: hypothetical protein VFG80_11670 [Myxococcota bacterium]|nr:hypothetical protein [Myxococcota bacterium]
MGTAGIWLSRTTTALGVAAAVAFAPVAASATPATFKRSIENLTQWPLDLALSPVVAGKTIYTNLQDVNDSTGVRIAYPIPGFVWTTSVQVGAAVLRGVTGVFEFLPGLILLPLDADMDPLFDPVVENSALVDYDNPVYHVKFGTDYTSGGE